MGVVFKNTQVDHSLLVKMCAQKGEGRATARFATIGGQEATSVLIGNVQVICFEGTGDLLDVINDVRIFPWKTDYGWCHAGFYKSARRWVNAHGGDLLDAWKHDAFESLCLTGHSLGAAISVQVAMQIGLPISQITLFGEPRSMFKSSKKKFYERGLHTVTTSYREGFDKVCSLPLPFWFQHCHEIKDIGRESGYDHSITEYDKAVSAL